MSKINHSRTHTWENHLKYHLCPKCGYILESRESFEYRLGKYQKDLICPKCEAHFTVNQASKPKFGPIWN